MAADLYREAENTAVALDGEGLLDEARSIREAIAAGSTATEILMAVRWHLRTISPRGSATAAQVRALIAAIDDVLR
jgi:hypothetical protein